MNSTVRAEEGGFVILRCGLSGKDVEWTKNGESITSYDGEVWLFDVDSSDEGEYSCTLNSQTNNHLLLIQGISSQNLILRTALWKGIIIILFFQLPLPLSVHLLWYLLTRGARPHCTV